MHGRYANITDLGTDEVQKLAEVLDTSDSLDYAITETSLGIGIEIWQANDVQIANLYCPKNRDHYDREEPYVDTDDSIGPYRCTVCGEALEYE